MTHSVQRLFFAFFTLLSLLLGAYAILSILLDLHINPNLHASRGITFMQQVTAIQTNHQGEIAWRFHTPLLKEGAAR